MRKRYFAEEKPRKRHYKRKSKNYPPLDFKPLTLIKLSESNRDDIDRLPFNMDEEYLYLGELSNNYGHAVIVSKDGEIFWGWHTDRFEKVKEEVYVFDTKRGFRRK